MSLSLIPQFVLNHYECRQWKHGCTILKHDFPGERDELMDVLTAFRLNRSWIETGGGRKSRVAASIDGALEAGGWKETGFHTRIVVDNARTETPVHKVDCFKNRVAVEIEWNNKDPFHDRDLNNFRLLFDLRTISVGVIITRCDDLQDIFKAPGRGASYGASTTHMSKLLPRDRGRGVGRLSVNSIRDFEKAIR